MWTYQLLCHTADLPRPRVEDPTMFKPPPPIPPHRKFSHPALDRHQTPPAKRGHFPRAPSVVRLCININVVVQREHLFTILLLRPCPVCRIDSKRCRCSCCSCCALHVRVVVEVLLVLLLPFMPLAASNASRAFFRHGQPPGEGNTQRAGEQ